MANTIDITGSTIVIRPSKTVKFENFASGGAGAKAGKNVSFPSKGEYNNLGKFTVLVGQSLKKMNVNVRDIQKSIKAQEVAITSLNKTNLDIAKYQKKNLDLQNKEIKRVVARDRAIDAQSKRDARERALESSRGIVKGATGAVKKTATAGKSLIERIFGPLGSFISGLGDIIAGTVGFKVIEKLLKTNAIPIAVGSFITAIASITKAIEKIPTGTIDKMAKGLGKVVKFVGAFVGDRITQLFNGIDQVMNPDGSLKFSLKGIANIIAGLGGLALALRYIKNPTKIISDVVSLVSFLGNLGKNAAKALPAGARSSSPAGAASAGAKAAQKSGYYDAAVATSKANAKKVPLGARLRGMRMPMNWGGPLPGSQYYDDVMTPATRAARAGSEYMMGIGRAGLKGAAGLAGRGLGMGVGALRSAPGALMGGIGKLAGGTGKALGAGFKGIGGRIPILGSLLAGGLEYAQSGNVGRAGGAAAGAGLGTAIGAGIGSVIPGAGTLVGGLAGGIIGEFIGKTIGEGVMSMFKGFDIGKTIFQPVSESFKWVTDALKEPIRMFQDAFGIGKGGEEGKESGFIGAMKNIGKIIGLLAKIIMKSVVPVLQVAFGAIGKAIQAVTFVIKGVMGAVSGALKFVGNMIDKIPSWVPGAGQLKGLKSAIGNFDLGKFLDSANNAVDSVDTSIIRKARGGKIFGGKPTGDSVPAYLERGEYVVNRKAVSAIGHQNLDRINFGMFPRFQSGGAVSKKDGWDKFASMGKTAGAKHDQLVAAQWALESGWGSALSGRNNFFGIKAAPGESSTNHKTQEVYNGKTVTVTAGFKNFNSPQDAVNHLVNQWYKDYKGYKGVNRAPDSSAAAHDLKKQGYATDPSYPGKLIKLMGGKGNASGVAYTSGGSGSSNVSGGAGSPSSPGASSNVEDFLKPWQMDSDTSSFFRSNWKWQPAQNGGLMMLQGGGSVSPGSIRSPGANGSTASKSGTTTPSAGDSAGGNPAIVAAAKAAVSQGRRGPAKPPCASWVRMVLGMAKHPAASKTTKYSDLDSEKKTWGPNMAASFAGSDMGTVIRSASALQPGDIVLQKNTYGSYPPGAITHVSIASDKKGKILHQSTSGGAPKESGLFNFAAGVRLGGKGVIGDFGTGSSDVASAGADGVSADSGSSFLTMADEGITSDAKIKTLTDQIYTMAGNPSGGGFGFSSGTGSPVAQVPPVTSPASVPQTGGPAFATDTAGGTTPAAAADGASSIANTYYANVLGLFR